MRTMRSKMPSLRKRAEEFLDKHPESIREMSSKNVKKLVEDLHIHQIELEIQNEELRRVQLDLEASRDRCSDLYDFAPVGYVTVSEKGFILQANLTIADMLGVERNLLIGKPFSGFVKEEDQDVFYLHRIALFKTKVKQVFALRLNKKDHSHFYAQMESIVVEDPAKNTTHIRIAVSDITDRKLAEEELKREIEDRKEAEKAAQISEERYFLAVAGSTDGIWDWDIPSKTVFYSDRFKEILGYAADKFPDTIDAFRSRLHPEDAHAVWSAVERHLQERVPYNIEYRLKTKSGEYMWFLARGQAIWDDEGNAIRMSGSIQDITDRKIQEAELRKTRNLLQTVFDGIPDPLVMLDDNLRIRIINRAAIHYFQVEKIDDIANICCFKALFGNSAPCEGCLVPEIIARQKSGSFERIGKINPNNLEQVNIYCFDEKSRKFGGALMRIHDITESKLMERRLIQKEKLSSLGLTISSINHEITNPISAINLNAPILKDYIRSMISIVDNYAKDIQDFELLKIPYPQFRKDVFRIVTNIFHASKRILTIVSDLRKVYGEKRQRAKDWCDLKQLIERLQALLGVEIKQYIKFFEINIPENLPKIYTDPVAVEQILTNLLINAAHAADKENSQIKLEVVQGSTWRRYLIIEIRDNGCGMDQQTLSKIFNPFFTTKEPGHGTGLGLYVCQNLIKELDGEIEVQSEPGNGSVFRVVLPDLERRSLRRL